MDKAPDEPGGLLDVESYRRRALTLNALVGSVAPNLDVSVVTRSEKGILPVTGPSDWLTISEVDLLCRLEPTLDGEDADVPKAGKVLMQPVTDSAGQVYGRAFIWPEQFSFSEEYGWITISGLKAAQLSNVRGVLLGEAIYCVAGFCEATCDCGVDCALGHETGRDNKWVDKGRRASSAVCRSSVGMWG